MAGPYHARVFDVVPAADGVFGAQRERVALQALELLSTPCNAGSATNVRVRLRL